MTSTTIETSLIAWLTLTGNTIGADAGISVEESIREDGIVCETREMARETVTDGSLNDADEADGINYEAAEALLRTMGFEILKGWTESGGQFAAEVARIA